MNQPEALRLADELTRYLGCGGTASQAAAELRRLHAKNERIYAQHASVVSDYEKAVVTLKAQRDALLEALKLARSIIGHPDDAHTQMIDAAIAKAEGEGA